MEKEIPCENRIDHIRNTCLALEGKKVTVKANMGRGRIIERAGILIQAHPALFVVEVNERRGRSARQTHKYVDILTGTVQLYNEDGELLFDYIEE